MPRRYTDNFARTRLRVPVGKQVELFSSPHKAHRATRARDTPGVLFIGAGIAIGGVFIA